MIVHSYYNCLVSASILKKLNSKCIGSNGLILDDHALNVK